MAEERNGTLDNVLRSIKYQVADQNRAFQNILGMKQEAKDHESRQRLLRDAEERRREAINRYRGYAWGVAGAAGGAYSAVRLFGNRLSTGSNQSNAELDNAMGDFALQLGGAVAGAVTAFAIRNAVKVGIGSVIWPLMKRHPMLTLMALAIGLKPGDNPIDFMNSQVDMLNDRRQRRHDINRQFVSAGVKLIEEASEKLAAVVDAARGVPEDYKTFDKTADEYRKALDMLWSTHTRRHVTLKSPNEYIPFNTYFTMERSLDDLIQTDREILKKKVFEYHKKELQDRIDKGLPAPRTKGLGLTPRGGPSMFNRPIDLNDSSSTINTDIMKFSLEATNNHGYNTTSGVMAAASGKGWKLLIPGDAKELDSLNASNTNKRLGSKNVTRFTTKNLTGKKFFDMLRSLPKIKTGDVVKSFPDENWWRMVSNHLRQMGLGAEETSEALERIALNLQDEAGEVLSQKAVKEQINGRIPSSALNQDQILEATKRLTAETQKVKKDQSKRIARRIAAAKAMRTSGRVLKKGLWELILPSTVWGATVLGAARISLQPSTIGPTLEGTEKVDYDRAVARAYYDPEMLATLDKAASVLNDMTSSQYERLKAQDTIRKTSAKMKEQLKSLRSKGEGMAIVQGLSDDPELLARVNDVISKYGMQTPDVYDKRQLDTPLDMFIKQIDTKVNPLNSTFDIEEYRQANKALGYMARNNHHDKLVDRPTNRIKIRKGAIKRGTRIINDEVTTTTINRLPSVVFDPRPAGLPR